MSEQQPALTVWQEPDGQWRWRWEGEGTVLVGHRAFDTEEEAEHSARSAYPTGCRPPSPPLPTDGDAGEHGSPASACCW
jgi:hypothetical protein